MKHQIVLPACLLLLWTLTAFVSGEPKQHEPEVIVTVVPDGIKLSCKDKLPINRASEPGNDTVIHLDYLDDNTGEYTCIKDGTVTATIFVKFRTCDNCIEFDVSSVIGIVAGNLVATIGIGVAVYLVASLAQTGSVTSHKKSSDRQHLVPNDRINSSNEHYQPLRRDQKDMYDVLHNRR